MIYFIFYREVSYVAAKWCVKIRVNYLVEFWPLPSPGQLYSGVGPSPGQCGGRVITPPPSPSRPSPSPDHPHPAGPPHPTPWLHPAQIYPQQIINIRENKIFRTGCCTNSVYSSMYVFKNVFIILMTILLHCCWRIYYTNTSKAGCLQYAFYASCPFVMINSPTTELIGTQTVFVCTQIC